MKDDTKRGSTRVFAEGGRWHVAEMRPTGLFGLGGDKWEQVTAIGYRSKSRADRRAARVQAKSYRFHDKWERQKAANIERQASEDAYIRSKLEQPENATKPPSVCR